MPRTALKRGGFARYGAGSRALPVQGLRQDLERLSGTPLSGLHHKERWLSFGASLAKGETVKASAARCDVAVSTAFRWRHRFLAAARSDSEVLTGDRGSGGPTSWKPEGRARAGTQGTAAGRQGEARPLARAGAGSWRQTGAERRSARCCPGSIFAAALDPVVAKDALLVSDGGATLPPLRRRARGEPRSTQPLDGGTGSGRSACADGEQPPQPVEGLPASSPWHRHPLSRQLPELVPPRWPRPRRQRPGLPRRRRDEVTHTNRELSLNIRLNSRFVCICDRIPSGGWIMASGVSRCGFRRRAGCTRAAPRRSRC